MAPSAGALAAARSRQQLAEQPRVDVAAAHDRDGRAVQLDLLERRERQRAGALGDDLAIGR